MKYYIIAGEPSGDLHGSNLMRELKVEDSSAQFRFWGGDLMASQGGEQVKHYRETAFMGVFEVFMNLRTIKRNFNFCESDIVAWNPDVIILIDYPGFNLRIARFAHNKGYNVFYYISPKLWAWNTKRVHKVKAYVDRMYTILPFETGFYQNYGVDVYYCGNPVLDAINSRDNKNENWETFITRNKLPDRPMIGILAGSRKQELVWILEDMLQMIDRFSDYQFVIAGAPSFTICDYEPYLKGRNVKILFGQTYEILQQSKVAMVTSGTATLEAGLLKCPQVVCYRMWGGKFTTWMRNNVIMKVPYFSLVNLILNREAVLELFQEGLNSVLLEAELKRLLYDTQRQKQLAADYDELIDKMGSPGASKKAAQLMVEHLSNKNIF
ncbi:MAG: lipid-A-disaccharide synthase [Marinilabiliaceae bacterium]|nr:lipid-A-disaccharide synthase [Marinilabiliaceae bacterium]